MSGSFLPRRFAALIAVLGTLGWAGCTPGPALERFPHGELSTPEAVVVAPDRNWSVPTGSSLWEFRGSATLRVRVLEAPGGPLEVTFDPVPEGAGYAYRASWNGEVLEGSEELNVGGAGEALQVVVPVEALAPGDHALELQRIHRRAVQALENRFESVAWTWAGGGGSLDPVDREPLRYLADFLTFGVTGVGFQDHGKVARGGWLFLGPRREARRFYLAAEGFLHLEAENASRSPAVFWIEGGDASARLEVPPGESRPFRRLLKAGSHSLTFAVEGAEDGLFLWAEGFLGVLPEEVPEPAPPVILVTLDTTRRDALSPYHGEASWTPVLDAFAARATVYDNAYATAPWTLPSHGSMMTGLYPSRHGAGVSEQFLPGALPTLAGLLRQRGYFTAGIAGGKLCSHSFGVGQGFHRYRDPDGFETTGDRVTDFAEALLGTHRDKPLFLFANYFDPHALYQAPPRYENRFDLQEHRRALEGQPVWRRFMDGDASAWRAIIDGGAPATPELLAMMRAAYRSEVAFMDAQLGRLFEALKEQDLFDRALIILVADHGELLGEHGLFSHAGRLDPELTEIPLIVKYPGQQQGERVPDLVSQVDLFATVLSAAGLSPEEIPAHDGHTLPRAAAGEAPAARRTLFLEEHESRVHPLPPRLKLGPRVYGVQRPDFRQIVWSSRTQNLDEAEFGGSCAALPEPSWRPDAWIEQTCEVEPEALYHQLQRRLGSLGAVENAGVLSREQEDALKALGYL